MRSLSQLVLKRLFIEIRPNPAETKYLLRLKRLFVKITKSSLLLVLPIKQTFDQNHTLSCVMKLCLTTTNGILETPIRTLWQKTSKLVIIKYFVIKNIKHFRTNTGHSQASLQTFRNYFRVVHLGSEVQLLSQITAENKC